LAEEKTSEKFQTENTDLTIVGKTEGSNSDEFQTEDDSLQNKFLDIVVNQNE
jgi:hypothetical protein